MGLKDINIHRMHMDKTCQLNDTSLWRRLRHEAYVSFNCIGLRKYALINWIKRSRPQVEHRTPMSKYELINLRTLQKRSIRWGLIHPIEKEAKRMIQTTMITRLPYHNPTNKIPINEIRDSSRFHISKVNVSPRRWATRCRDYNSIYYDLTEIDAQSKQHETWKLNIRKIRKKFESGLKTLETMSTHASKNK